MMHARPVYPDYNSCTLEITVSKHEDLDIHGGGQTGKALYALSSRFQFASGGLLWLSPSLVLACCAAG
jgi:hypothetical protein